MMTDPYQESAIPVYVVTEAEIALDATPPDVWPIMLDIGAWQNFTKIDYLAGPVGGEGELLALRKDEPGAGKSAYLARTCMIDRNKTILWKIYREVEAQGDANLGIVQFTLTPQGDQTLFKARVIYEFGMPQCAEAEWMALRDKYNENVRTLLSGVLPKLQTLVKSRMAARSAA